MKQELQKGIMTHCTNRKLISSNMLRAASLLLLAAASSAQQPPAAPAKSAPAQASPAPSQPKSAPAQNQTTAPAPAKIGVSPNATPTSPSGLVPAPVFPVSKRETKQFVVEYVYDYAKMDYTPAVRMTPVKRETANYSNPEEAFTSFYSSIQALDYDWWITNWDAASVQMIKDRDAKLNRGADFWRQAWEKSFKGKSITLLQRIETRVYVIILYTVTDPAKANAQVHKSMLVLKREGDRFVATQELGGDEFYHNYLEGRDKLTRNVELEKTKEFGGDGFRQQVPQREFFAAYPKGTEKITHVVR